MTLRLPLAPGHPTFDAVVTSWWAIERSEFERRAAAFERARTEAAEAAARAAAEAAAATTTIAQTGGSPPASGAAGTTTTSTTTTTTTTTTVPPAPPEIYVDHDPLVVGDQASMIRLRTAVVFDGPPEFADATFYVFEHGDVLPGIALVAPERRDALVDWVRTLLDTRAGDWTGVASTDLLADVELTEGGSLRIGIPTRYLASGGAIETVELDAAASESFLSDLGRALRDGDPVVPARAEPADCTVERCVALTFDDGPVPATDRLLNVLAATRTPATFFVLGSLVEQHSELIVRIVTDGHELGNHGWSHRAFPAMTADEQREDHGRAEAVIEAVTGMRPSLFRPPYGRYDDHTRRLGDALVLWDVDTRDWEHRDPARTAATISELVESGSIVLLHDLHSRSVAAVPMLVAELHAAGYRLVTVSELLGPTEPGSVHRSQSDGDPPPPPTTTTSTPTTMTTTPAAPSTSVAP